VKLDGREVGKTPLTLERLPVGEHTLELDKDGTYAARRQVAIAANTLDKLSLRLDRLKGKLTILSEPREASVTLDGQTVGTTPLSLDADAGPHTLRLTKEGYKPYEETLTLPANKETRTRIALKSTRGTLEVRTTPPGATVEIAGTRHGQTPITLSAEEGSYNVRLSLSKHRSETRRAEIAAERLTRLQVDLTPGPGPGEIERRGKDNAEMLYIPGGTFTMGDTHGEGDSDEKPTHQVTVADFWLDRTEVTNAQFARFVKTGGYRPQGEWQKYAGGKDQHPVVDVTWHDAVAYCRWADKRLPTEAEWEYAARGTDGRKYPWGNTWEDSRARFSGNRGNQTTAPVGSYPTGASPLGVLDMAGNVWEWTSSLYKPYPYSATDGREDLNASGSRVYRGGSWGNVPGALRAADRGWNDPANRSNNLGFRCAQGVD
jgi:formylglycine-generating enzyme required for sulfatase activity